MLMAGVLAGEIYKHLEEKELLEALLEDLEMWNMACYTSGWFFGTTFICGIKDTTDSDFEEIESILPAEEGRRKI